MGLYMHWALLGLYMGSLVESKIKRSGHWSDKSVDSSLVSRSTDNNNLACNTIFVFLAVFLPRLNQSYGTFRSLEFTCLLACLIQDMNLCVLKEVPIIARQDNRSLINLHDTVEDGHSNSLAAYNLLSL
jgi:hypothetical protein